MTTWKSEEAVTTKMAVTLESEPSKSVAEAPMSKQQLLTDHFEFQFWLLVTFR